MAVQSVRTCDLCNSVDSVQIITWVYGKKAGEADICQTCYEKRVKEYGKNVRRPTRSTIKPQHRFEKTDIAKVNL